MLNMINEREPELDTGLEMDMIQISGLAIGAAIEIDYYQRRKIIPSNSFSKLSKILYKTLEPNDFLNGKRLIDNYSTYRVLYDILKRHEKSKRETPYKIDIKIDKTTKVNDLVSKLVPVIHKISKDLVSFTKSPEENQEFLINFLTTMSEKLLAYWTSPKQYITA